MFAVKWIVGGVVNSVVDNTKRGVSLLQNTFSYVASDTQTYLTHFNDKPAEEIISNYQKATADIMTRQQQRKELRDAKRIPDSTTEKELLIVLKEKISVLALEVEADLKTLRNSYGSLFKQKMVQVKVTEQMILRDLQCASTLHELKAIAHSKTETLKKFVGKESVTLQLLQEICSLELSELKHAKPGLSS